MDKDIIKEIFLLILELLKALCEMLWKTVKAGAVLIWDRFFGAADATPEQPSPQEWGVTGEDEWPSAPEVLPVPAPEAPHVTKEERKEEVRVVQYVPPVPELTDSYGENRIVLMVKDPLWLFTYWEIQKDAVAGSLNVPGMLAHGARVVLRVYDVTDIVFNGNNAHKHFDLEVFIGAKCWYVHTSEPDRAFCVDVGLLTPDGTFHTLARSNVVRTPRLGLSHVVDEEWLSIYGLYEKVYLPLEHRISESMFERTYKNWQESLNKGVSSPEPVSSSSALKK